MIKGFFKKIFITINEADTNILLFCFFIFILPFWKRIEFFTPYSLLDGEFIEYLTYSVFGFDLVLSLVFVFWSFKILLRKKKNIIFNRNIFLSFLLLIIFSLISIIFSTYFFISLYYIFTLIVCFVLMIFLFNNIKSKRDVILILSFFVLSMTFQSIVAIFQFLKNQSLGISLMGEQLISSGIPGIAKVLIEGEKHIRSYGTFSHPNILALFLLLALITTVYLFNQYKEKYYKYFLFFSFLIFLVAIFFTFSRIIWILTLIFLMIYLFKEKKRKIYPFLFLKNKKNILCLVLFSLILAAILFYLVPLFWLRINPFLPSTWESFNDRMVVIEKSWLLIKNHLFFGVGIGNFVIEIAYLLTGYPVWMAEPVHNTFILILTEIGIFGLISYLFMLYYIYRESIRLPYMFKYMYWVLIIYMFFDHCFWDIRQVQYIFFTFIGIILVLNSKKEIHDVY